MITISKVSGQSNRASFESTNLYYQPRRLYGRYGVSFGTRYNITHLSFEGNHALARARYYRRQLIRGLRAEGWRVSPTDRDRFFGNPGNNAHLCLGTAQSA